MDMGDGQVERYDSNRTHYGGHDLFPGLAALARIGEMSAGEKL